MALKRRLWRRFRGVLPVLGEAFAAPSLKQALIDQEIRAIHADLRQRTPDNPALGGFKVFSQVDEDGNGSENNTHYLALQGWKGVWVDGSAENIGTIAAAIPLDTPALLVQQMFITRDNIAAATAAWLARLGGGVDLLSLDIDGNDAAVLDRILTVVEPRVLVLEYNGKFPPPLKLSVAYKADHAWGGDDYYGSSLQVFVDQLDGRYRLVSCGISGANAYFVRADVAGAFTPYTTQQLYMAARHHLIQRRGAASASLKFLRDLVVA
jgi:hypothetical protein